MISDGFFNVRSAGAKGDGSADDTAAIQKAIDLAAECDGTVLVPPGYYKTGRLTLRPHVALVGSVTSGYRECRGSVLRLADAAAPCLIDATHAVGARMDSLNLDGGELGDGVHGILVEKPDCGKTEDTLTIERSHVTRFSGDGIRLERIWAFRLRGNIVSNNGGNGVSVRGWDGFAIDNWFSVNGGAGSATIGENNAMTVTGNRIEWNRSGGIRVWDGSHYNIVGNYIDRSGPGLLFCASEGYREPEDRVLGRVGYSTITGNIIYRSGRPIWGGAPPCPSAHIVLLGVRGVVVSGNTLVAGRDDENPSDAQLAAKDSWSPDFGMVIGGLRHVIIKDNILDSAALRDLVVDRGGHGDGVVLRDNVGELFKP